MLDVKTKKTLRDRPRRIAGQVEAIERMVGADRYCFSSVSVVGNALRLRRAGDGEGRARPADKGGDGDRPLHRKLRARGTATSATAGLLLVTFPLVTLPKSIAIEIRDRDQPAQRVLSCP